ncbi:Mitochondrial distribution/morphology family 35/apoptosis [Globisporangium polare]
MADAKDEEPGCWQKKAVYEQCFDQWYKDVFLQQKADGQAGCREEYTAYWNCFMKELRKDKTLVDGIKGVMPPDASARWTANMAAQDKAEQQKNNSSNSNKSQ